MRIMKNQNREESEVHDVKIRLLRLHEIFIIIGRGVLSAKSGNCIAGGLVL
jgi:hypothetical protein